jgi:hypothetical protein
LSRSIKAGERAAALDEAISLARVIHSLGLLAQCLEVRVKRGLPNSS